MLIDKKNPDSFFKPYYDVLPKTLRNMPIFWNEEELQYLTGSFLLEQIYERNVAIEADYVAICEISPEFSSIATMQEFKWARMCVCSRNFGLVINGVQTAALVPYADMLNHFRPRETKWQFDDNLQGFTVVSLQKIGIGAQVYDSYGRKCNHRFLLNYGFSVENNYESDGFCPNEVFNFDFSILLFTFDLFF
jgi:histone-lysine N-methyltransferase SETD3